jgi:hypothetical protein
VHSADLHGFADFITAWWQFGPEEEMGRIFAPYGKLIAVGSPGETLGWPGVTRLYLPPEDWPTPLSEAMRLLAPSRLLLLMPAEPGDYNAFRRTAAEWRLTPCMTGRGRAGLSCSGLDGTRCSYS